MTYALFIDDERLPPRGDGRHWIVARDFDEVQLTLWREGMPQYISFDHDLGDVDAHTGYDIAKYLCDLDMVSEDLQFPSNFDFYVHSQNPVGAENIRMYIKNYLKHKND